jgi:hypothetical protein
MDDAKHVVPPLRREMIKVPRDLEPRIERNFAMDFFNDWTSEGIAELNRLMKPVLDRHDREWGKTRCGRPLYSKREESDDALAAYCAASKVNRAAKFQREQDALRAAELQKK